MKNLRELSRYRQITNENIFNKNFDLSKEGTFVIKLNDYSCLYVQALNHFGWEHIGAYVVNFGERQFPYRIPTSKEMEFLKNLFFEKDEAVIEVHPRKCDYVNINIFMLHLWRPNRISIPVPPKVHSFDTKEILKIGETHSFFVETSRKDGWEIYRVSTLLNVGALKRTPSWDEMCLVKKEICGEDAYALQYHLPDNQEEDSICLYVPPKDIKMPIPEPFMVGNRNEDDVKAFKMRKKNPNEYVYL